MLPFSTKPFDSCAVRWQQRSCKAAGEPSSLSQRTIFSPSKVNGLGPSLSMETGIRAYQKRRRTFCFVTSMVQTPLKPAMSFCACRDKAKRPARHHGRLRREFDLIKLRCRSQHAGGAKGFAYFLCEVITDGARRITRRMFIGTA